jgi:predicted alpha/beta superfamily hydrolase
MKYLFFFSLLLMACTNAMPHEAGFADSITSKLLNEKRRLLIYTPYADRKTKSNNNKRYPIIYVLDGENHFKAVTAIVQQLAGYGTCPEMIVIGILMGHSLGGLMVINTMVRHPNLFNAYIAIDAAIWWDKQKVLNQAKANLANQSYRNKTLYLTMANRMEKGIDTTAVQLDTNEATELIRHNLDLIHHLNTHPNNGPRFGYSYYPNETHGTVTFISCYDALRFIFQDFPLPKTKAYQTDNPELAKLITTHYQQISKQMGYLTLPDASTINSLGYRAMALKQLELAKELFVQNLTNYPTDPNLMDSMGDYYALVNDKKNAIIFYQKALAIIEIAETRKKLNALKL